MAANLMVTGADFPFDDGQSLLIEATRQLSLGIKNADPSWFRVLLVQNDSISAPYNIITQYRAKFGNLIANRRIFIRVTVFGADGQRSNPVTGSCVVA
jgi:hypothetical protein